jgi:hypothetical protein
MTPACIAHTSEGLLNVSINDSNDPIKILTLAEFSVLHPLYKPPKRRTGRLASLPSNFAELIHVQHARHLVTV